MVGQYDNYEHGIKKVYKEPRYVTIPSGWRPAEFSYDPARRERAKKSIIEAWDSPPKGGKTMEQEIRDMILRKLDVRLGYPALRKAIGTGECMDVIKPILHTIKEFGSRAAGLRADVKECKFTPEQVAYLRDQLGTDLADWLELEVEPLTLLEVCTTLIKHFRYHIAHPSTIDTVNVGLEEHLHSDIKSVIAGNPLAKYHE